MLTAAPARKTMFTSEFDSAFACAVLLFALPFEEGDFARHVELLPMLDARMEGRDRPVIVLEFEDGYPVPNALWRKRMVEARANVRSRPVVALVTPSFAQRAGAGLAAWIRPPQFEQRVFSTFEEAMKWIGEKRGVTTKILHKLRADAKDGARSGPKCGP